MDDKTKTAVDRVIEFLGSCGNADIEAGVGQIFGVGSREQIEAFEAGIAAAMAEEIRD